VALAGYLLGSVPTGYLVAKARGVDIRQVGSGNIGATNALRVLGKPLGILVLLVDALKGALACGGLPRLAAVWGATVPAADPSGLAITAGVAAILGHNYTCWLGFRGGKGIATSAGVLLVLMPWVVLVVFGVWVLAFAVGRWVSLASICAALALPLVIWGFGHRPLILGLGAFLSALALYRHRANIQRLWAGTESRFGSAANRREGRNQDMASHDGSRSA
jgi:glycerol-3-phosphate acyltransferase PlsY